MRVAILSVSLVANKLSDLYLSGRLCKSLGGWVTKSEMMICILPFVVIILVSTYLFANEFAKRKAQAKDQNKGVFLKVLPLFFLWIIVLTISGLIMVLGIWFYNLDAPTIETGEEKAKPLLNAIQNYKQETGSYPVSLQSLVPEYISDIPAPAWRHDYCYDRRRDGESFTLAFVPNGEVIGDGWNVYSSKLNTWTRVDSDFYQPCHFFFDN